MQGLLDCVPERREAVGDLSREGVIWFMFETSLWPLHGDRNVGGGGGE